MSIYNPPSKTQGIFNPSNFGGLGAGGKITTDYLDANYLSFPIAQGNTTLVGTNVLGDITQQGDFSTTGNLLVNDVNIITEIDAKQTATTNTIIVNVGDNLKDTINNMGVNDTIKVSGGTFTDNISISTNSGTRTQGNVVGEKNKTILNGNLTIRSGVLFSLTNFKIAGNTYVNNNTIFLPFESINQSFTNCEFKMIELRGGNQTLTFTDCKINNSFRSLNARISGIINFIRCDFTGSSFNLLHPENKNAIVMTDCIGLPDDVALDTQNYTVKGITGYTTKIGAFLSHSYTANETPTLTNELTSKSYVDSQVGTKQNTINDDDLTIAQTAELQTALDDKQDTIEDGDLTIAFTDGLQSALNDKQPTIEDGDLTIANTNGLQSALNDKQDTIEDGDLTIAKTSGLQTALDNKQDEITTDADLTLNSITTTDLVVNESLNIDNVITYEKYRQFDTLVIRRFDNTSTLPFNLNEIQVFVNNDNILFPNPTGLTSYFADWSDKFTPIAPRTVNTVTEKVYNNIIEYSVEAESTGSTTALIINNIPLTFLNDIQAIVLYHRGGDGNILRSLGLTIELYNSVDDPTLTQVLASTIPITDETKDYLQRYDFPSISTYTNGFFSTTYQSTTQIPDIGKGQQSTATINDIDTDIHINSNVDISGTITLPIIGDVKTSIQGNTDNILTNTNNLSGVQTQVDALINFTGGGVNFRAYSLSSVTINAGNNLTYDNEDYDTENSYDTSNNIYTIVISGTYVFSFGWYVVSGSTAVINLIRKRNSVETILQQSTNGTNTGNNSGFFSTTIAECETNDEIYAYLDSGSCRLIPYGISDPDTFTSFSGSRISN